MGHDPGRWCMFHKVKGNLTKDCYQLKKEGKLLIQEGHINKSVKGNHSQGLGRSKFQGWDDA